jgi:propionate CoA-transferase
MTYTLPKIVSAAEAVACIDEGMTLAINTMSAVSYPDALSSALYDRFHETGAPRNLCFWGSTAQAMHSLDALSEHLARCDGMFDKVVMGTG